MLYAYLDRVGCAAGPDCLSDLLRQGQELLGLSDRDIAHAFGASLPTVERWREGLGSPHPIACEPVYTWLWTKIQNRIQVMNDLKLMLLREDEHFPDLFAEACAILGVTEKEVAHEFSASRQTVANWRKVAPYPATCRSVRAWLLQKVEAQLG